MDSKHKLAEGRQTGGPGRRQARRRREDREDGRPGADGRIGRMAGQEQGRLLGGMTCAVLLLEGQMWGRGW